ncbi:hypothetical protein MMC25_004414 [Agyrium rufum]|nr:hypothetical protein [Agyrium rufum]
MTDILSPNLDDRASEDGAIKGSRRPTRQRSFSLTLSKFTTEAFQRRRTIDNPDTKESPTLPRSRIPTPSGIPHNVYKSGSFFSNLSPFLTKSGDCTPMGDNSKLKSTSRFAQSSFFSPSRYIANNSSHPKHSQGNSHDARKHHRKSSQHQIYEHKLMAPLQPDIPRSKTMGMMPSDPLNAVFSGVPNFARPTSSSKARAKPPGSITSPGAENINPQRPHASHEIGIAHSTPSRLPRSIVTPGANNELTVRSMSKSMKSPHFGGGEGRLPKNQSMSMASTALQPPLSSLPIRASKFAGAPETAKAVTMTRGTPQRVGRAALTSQLSESWTVPKMPTTPLRLAHRVDVVPLAKPKAQSLQLDNAVEEGWDFEDTTSGEEEAGVKTPTPETVTRSHLVTSPQPHQYWLGRFSSLSDQYRNEILNTSPDKRQLDRFGDHARRTEVTLGRLSKLVATPSALDSYFDFEKAYRERLQLEKRAESGEKVDLTGKAEETKRAEPLTEAGKVREKRGVFERLLDKGRRRSSGKKLKDVLDSGEFF